MTWDELVAEYGYRSPPPVNDFVELASAAHHYRYSHDAADRDEINRSTALWALMTVDKEVDAALADCGLDRARLQEKLGLSEYAPDVEDGTVHDPYVDMLFAEAIHDHLRTRTSRGDMTRKEVALAILQSVRLQQRGVLPSRLRQLGLDVDAAILSLENMYALLADFSKSVRTARKRIGTDSEITASGIVAVLQKLHPEYGGGRLGHVLLRESVGQYLAVDEWLRRVRTRYDMDAVGRTHHEVIDGKLLVLGLVELDAALDKDLMKSQVLDALRKEVELQPLRARGDARWSTDSLASEDLLGRMSIAKALAHQLVDLNGPVHSPDHRNSSGDLGRTDSFVVHIDGPWGSGKSSLLQFLESLLIEEFLVVHVNAWREQQLGSQWWPLHRALREAIEDREARGAAPGEDSRGHREPAGGEDEFRATPRSLGRGGLRAAHPWSPRRVRAKLISRLDVICVRPTAFVLAVLGPSVLVLSSLAVLVLSAGEFEWWQQVLATMLPVLATATVAYHFFMPDSPRSTEAFIEKSANPMSEVRLLFKRTLSRSKLPVVFFIDDLDRCEPEYVIEFLEVVQNLVKDAPVEKGASSGAARPGPYAFVAADGEWIRSSYENHFRAISTTEVPGKPLGYLFLEKVFQLQIRLASISEDAKTAFYESLLGAESRSSAPPEQVVQAQELMEDFAWASTGSQVVETMRGRMPEDPKLRVQVRSAATQRAVELGESYATLHELSPFGRFLEPNPRSVRLFVNLYAMLLACRIAEGTPVGVFPLALWAVVEVRWPVLADYLRSHPADVEPGKFSKDGPPHLKDLIDSPDVVAVIRDSGFGALTQTHVRQCTGNVSSTTPVQGLRVP
ncbi:P-loop NTPase fold protein [Kocuria sp. CPCC 205300]|uniref:KAP family P-loop NTPase fold protein n=1 Tax=Kocuria sabuli TaxID=3071448 RepID=UPI0036DE48A2